ncbi:BspA family leucine-rich repeat surface protein [Segatella copri]|uniref:BspA family leucine-rich repeat surface protein n=2 Tax=Segatella copri TaxID=165179 RepID=A0AA92SX53_9BACT|nr:BspA family leucine-rich repeat surface protein [Segatella copri]
MLLMLLFVPTRMVAQTPTEDSRYALFKNLEGITDVTITDNGSYPWQELDLNAEGMTNLGFTIPEGSKGLMSSNYNVDGSSSETVVNFTVEKPMLLTFKYLVSSEYNFDKATITLDNKEPWTISEKKQIEIKALLSVGEHSLKLSYTKDVSGNENADRTCIYDLKTATTFSEYVADYVATNSTLTFKKITSDNLEGLDLSRLAMVDNIDGVQDVCTNYSSIKNIVFDESFKTYAPTSLREFFKGCETLETISGLEYLNTAKVTDMGNMFHGCSALTSLDLTNFNTANVEFMDNMFEGCSALESLNLTNFNTENVTNMSCMFMGCSGLESLNLTNFNTENVTDMSWMFYGCSALKSLDLTNFNTAKVTYMNNMFEGCSALTTIYVSNKFVTDNVSNGSDMFTGCKSLKDYSDSKTDHTYANCGTTGYFTPVFDYAEFDNATGTLTFRRGLSKPEGAYDLNEGDNTPEWRKEKEPEDGSFVPGVKIDISKVVFDASFANARPTSCYKWFDMCTSLTEIEGIENLHTENVTNMGSMFSGCYVLNPLDVSNFNTQNVEDMSDMFVSCMNLKSLNVSNFDTQKVKDMNDMFYNCNSLTPLDVSNFNTQNVENMSYMFSCCEGLNSLDLSKFDTQKVTNMNSMFWNSSALTTIYASDKFVTTKVSSGADMFKGCTNLKGFIEYNKNTDKDKDNYKYANYKTGYFSKLVGKNGDEKIGAAGENLAAYNLTLEDGKDFVAYEPFAAKAASYSRKIKVGSTWGTLCLPFAIDQSKETECKFYRLTGIDNDCITLESYEGAEIPAGTPVLFKMNEGVQELEISAQNADLVKEPVAGTDSDVNLVGSFTKIGGKDNQGLDKNDYIIGKDKFWRVSDLNDGNGVGIKPMRAYIHPATASQARAAMLSIGKGDGTTAIDNLNAISNDANAEYYDANGRRTNGLQKGLNIVKRGSKTYKIMVK